MFWCTFRKDVIFGIKLYIASNISWKHQWLVDLVFPKNGIIVMTTSLWNSNIPILCFCTMQKSFHAFYCPYKERPPPSCWPNANSICWHKLIEQISITHLFVLVLKRFQNWYINSFLGWLWPLLICADRITADIVGGTSNNCVIQPRHYQIFTFGSKIVGSSRFLC